MRPQSLLKITEGFCKWLDPPLKFQVWWHGVSLGTPYASERAQCCSKLFHWPACCQVAVPCWDYIEEAGTGTPFYLQPKEWWETVNNFLHSICINSDTKEISDTHFSCLHSSLESLDSFPSEHERPDVYTFVQITRHFLAAVLETKREEWRNKNTPLFRPMLDA